MISTPAGASLTADMITEIRKAETAALVRRIDTGIDPCGGYPNFSVHEEPYWQSTRGCHYSNSARLLDQLSVYGGTALSEVHESTGMVTTTSKSSSEECTVGTASLGPASVVSSGEVGAGGGGSLEIFDGAETEILDWDAYLAASPVLRTRQVKAKLRKIVAPKPLPIDDVAAW